MKKELCDAFISLVQIMERLRAPDGCPWDAKQTQDTIKMYLLEEAYEVVDAVDKKEPDMICEELGDLLFQIIFLAQLAKEKEEFSILDVIEKVRDKMIRRHPHVFGDLKVSGAEEVVNNWAKIKMQEKKIKAENFFDSIPSTLPALMKAHRISERAAKVGFDWKNRNEIWDKVEEEFLELKNAIEHGDKEKVKEEIGDLIFSLVNLARHWGLNAENILRDTNNKFMERFAKMAYELKQKGLNIEDATLEQMDKVWEKIKKDV